MICNNVILLYYGVTLIFFPLSVLVDPFVFDHWIWRCWRSPVSHAFGSVQP